MSEVIKDIPPVFWSRSQMILSLVLIIVNWEKTLPSPSVTASTAPIGSPASTPVKRDTRTGLKKG